MEFELDIEGLKVVECRIEIGQKYSKTERSKYESHSKKSQFHSREWKTTEILMA